jgi:hypothetical protein
VVAHRLITKQPDTVAFLFIVGYSLQSTIQSLLFSPIGNSAGSGSTVNKDAVGAQARIAVQGQTLTRQVEGGTGQRNENDFVLHFGLGNHDTPVDLEVTWPGGTTQTIQDIAVDQFIAVEQKKSVTPTGASAAKAGKPSRVCFIAQGRILSVRLPSAASLSTRRLCSAAKKWRIR